MSVTDLVILDHMAQTSSPLRRLLVEHSAVLAELVKLRAEVETMRPVYVAAVEWSQAGHTGDANCSAGDCDNCPARPAEQKLFGLLLATEEP